MSLRAASGKAGRPGWRMRIARWQVRARPRLSRLARAAAHRRQAATALRGHSRRKGCPEAESGKQEALGKQSRAAMAGAGVALRMADRGGADCPLASGLVARPGFPNSARCPAPQTRARCRPLGFSRPHRLPPSSPAAVAGPVSRQIQEQFIHSFFLN